MSTDDKIEQRSRELLQAGVDRIEGRVRSRLTRARFAAVEEASARGRGSFWRTWLPAGGVAAAAVLAVVLWSGQRPDRAGPDASIVEAGGNAQSEASPSPMDDLDLMMASESFELLEDLEFYEWVDGELAEGGLEVG